MSSPVVLLIGGTMWDCWLMLHKLDFDNSDIVGLATNDSSGMGDHISIQTRSFARGHQDGAVRYLMVPIFQRSRLRRGSSLPLFAESKTTSKPANRSAHDGLEGSHDPCHDKETRERSWLCLSTPASGPEFPALRAS